MSSQLLNTSGNSFGIFCFQIENHTLKYINSCSDFSWLWAFVCTLQKISLGLQTSCYKHPKAQFRLNEAWASSAQLFLDQVFLAALTKQGCTENH